MARSLRLEYAGAIYHVTTRGNERRAIFKDDGDRAQFLTCLEMCVKVHRVRVYLFCLMPNHFHLVIETPRANLSIFMHSLLTRYTVYFNRRHRRRGHLTQGRYGAKVVESDGTGNQYLLALSRYVHLNPVFIGTSKSLPIEERIKELRRFRWSSYGGYVDDECRLPWVEVGPVLAQMDDKVSERPASYRRYVECGLAETDEDVKKALWASSRCIGGDRFREWVEAKHQELTKQSGSMEDVAFRRMECDVSTDQVLKTVESFCGVRRDGIMRRQRGSITRGIAARWLTSYSGMTQREVAKVLGLRTGAAISAQLRVLGRRLLADPELSERVNETERRLNRQAGRG